MFSCYPDPSFVMESRPFPSSHTDFPSSSFLPFHDSPFHDLILPSVSHSPPTPPPAPPFPAGETSPPPKKSTGGRKRAARKDRHSKIVTAQGPRDRRMRLNLEVAPQFFSIQDMLGYDKASKTVKWLMKEAKASIEKLRAAARGGDRAPSASASGLDQSEGVDAPKPKRAARHPSKRPACPSSLSRASRDMARARARERTQAKSDVNGFLDCGSEWNELLSSSSHDLKSSLDLVAEVDEQCSTSISQYSRVAELSVSVLDYSSTSSFFSHDQWGVSQFASIEDGQARLWSS